MTFTMGITTCRIAPADAYITCPRKGHPRKHVSVCRRCRWKNCRPFQKWLQPELPLVFRKIDRR